MSRAPEPGRVGSFRLDRRFISGISFSNLSCYPVSEPQQPIRSGSPFPTAGESANGVPLLSSPIPRSARTVTTSAPRGSPSLSHSYGTQPRTWVRSRIP
jgi:hypothetical protein